MVLATPAFEAGRLLRGVDEEAAGLAGASRTPRPQSSSWSSRRAPPGDFPPGPAYVAPPGEGSVTAATWVSRKWPREEFGSRALVRCFVGRGGPGRSRPRRWGPARLGPGRPAQSDPALPDPEASAVVRWPRSMPQYEVGHLDRLAALDRAIEARPGLFVTGAAYRGVGISDCVRQAGETAERVRDYLGGRGTAGPAGAPVDEEAIDVDDLTFAYYPAFRARPAWAASSRRSGPAGPRGRDPAQGVVRPGRGPGTYSTVGFRADTDLLMWWVARSAEDVQDLVAEFRRTGLGRRLEPTHAFLGLVRPAEFSRDHLPASCAARSPSSICACTRSSGRPSGTSCPPRSGRPAREHGEFGREFPDVLANTTSAFGLADWEWILAFEADRPTAWWTASGASGTRRPGHTRRSRSRS